MSTLRVKSRRYVSQMEELRLQKTYYFPMCVCKKYQSQESHEAAQLKVHALPSMLFFFGYPNL